MKLFVHADVSAFCVPICFANQYARLNPKSRNAATAIHYLKANQLAIEQTAGAI